MRHILGVFTALAALNFGRAAVVEHHWEATWVWASPDGYGRPVIGINGQWPCPEIVANKDDQIVVHLTNKLGNQTTGIHWHGINQVNTNPMDGAVMATQCPLPPGSSMTYAFTAYEAGTYWWHSHDLGQYPDGLRGILIIHDPDDPYAGWYDEEYTLTVTDWYHEQSIPLVQQMLRPNNTHFAPPLPNGLLVNEGNGANYVFDESKAYRFRILSFAALTSFMIHFNSHAMTVIMIDASYVKAERAEMVRISPGQRYNVLIRGKGRRNHKVPANREIRAKESQDYPFLVAMDANKDYTNPDLNPQWKTNFTGYLVTHTSRNSSTVDVVHEWNPINDSQLMPYGDTKVLPDSTKQFLLDFRYCRDENDIPRACIDDHLGDTGPYVSAKIPTLYTAVTTGKANTNREVYGHVHPLIVKYGEVVDIILNNYNDAIHPFHLHGHQFEVLKRPASGAGRWPGPGLDEYNQNPPRRDTVSVYGNSYVVIRFKADNPGVYLFHCHIEWHVEMGLSATVIEAPEVLRNYTIPQDHIDACKALNMPYAGNAGGNTVDVFDTSNYNEINEYPYEGPTYKPSDDSPGYAQPLARSLRISG